MGLGVIGGQVARGLTEKAELLATQAGRPLVLRRIKVLEQDLSRPQAQQMDPSLFTTGEEEFFSTPDMDIVIELIGGEQPAFSYHKRILEAGKRLVTANKDVIARHGAELAATAREHDTWFYFEAAVGGGIPLIAPFQRDLIANIINGIYAIINGTTNYILSRMSREGIDFADALAQAQKLGYAEADPRKDVEGIDAAYKLAIMASLAFQSQVKPEDIYCEGISRIGSRDFRYAKEWGFTIKLLAIAKDQDGAIEARVHPVFIPSDRFLAKVDGVYNAILVDGELIGQVTFIGRGAGAEPTSSAVVADVIRAAHDIACGNSEIHTGRIYNKPVRPMSELKTRYYIRMNIADRAGVLAQIAGVFGDNSISIASAIQKEADEKSRTAEIVIMTHPAKEKSVQTALAELKKLDSVIEINNTIRVEE